MLRPAQRAPRGTGAGGACDFEGGEGRALNATQRVPLTPTRRDATTRCPHLCHGSTSTRARASRGGRRSGGRLILIQRQRTDPAGEGVRDRGPCDLNPTADTRARSSWLGVRLVDWAEPVGSSPSRTQTQGTVNLI